MIKSSLFSSFSPLSDFSHLFSIAPPLVRLAEIRPGELIFNWGASTGRLTGISYSINSTCGTCPNMTNTTMVTCSDLSLSTVLTTCTFSVHSVACDTTGTPSLPIVVALGGNSVSPYTFPPTLLCVTTFCANYESGIFSFSPRYS